LKDNVQLNKEEHIKFLYIPQLINIRNLTKRSKVMNCWLCGADVDVEIIYESEYVGQVEGYECRHCGHTGETGN